MISSSQLSVGIIIKLNSKLYKVESAVKISILKGTPFIKTKLKELINDSVREKNFKLDQKIEDVKLEEHMVEYLYSEGKEHVFLDVFNFDQVRIKEEILKKAISFLKEGIQLKGFFYDNKVYFVELPQFLELMVVKIEENDKSKKEEIKQTDSSNVKKAVLETGAIILVPLFIEVGDVIKIDVPLNEYIQRV